MLSNTQLTVIRTAATAAVTALATLQVLYPSYTWIAAATAAFATLGIHAIPAIQQKGNMMTDGLTAMGLVPAVQTVEAAPAEAAPAEAAPAEAAPATVETPEAPEPSPVATPEEVSTAARQALTDAANALLKIAESL